MKKIKQFAFLIYLVTYLNTSSAQPAFTAEVSQIFPSFKFKDSEGVKLNSEYQSLITGAYGIGLRFITEGGIIFKGGIGMRTGGANLLYDETNYSWKLQYGDLKLGLGYRVNFKTVKPYITASGYYATMLRGTQIINNEHINVLKSSALSNRDYGLVFSPGIDIRFSKFISSFIEFNYLLGLANIELGSNQNAKNSSVGVSIGVATSLIEK
ncbi:MAG: hypothetical protein WBC35_14370 [Saprospiraceae bacterium]